MHKLLALRGNPFRYGALAGFTALALTACGGGGSGGDGAAIEAREQTITFQDVPVLYLNGTVTVSAAASSGLPVTYSSRTNSICSVDPTSGLVTALRQGNCIILADQSGNATWAARNRSLTIPVEVSEADKKITFSPLADLVIYGQATVSASIGSNQPLEYASLTPDTCASTTKGVVEALAAGDCSILAKAVEAGGSGGKTAQTLAADTPAADVADHSKEAVLTFPVTVPENTTAPGTPKHVKASAGATPHTVEIVVGEIDSGGLPVTYHVTSSLVGTIASTKEPGKPIVVDCQTSCRGHAFAVSPSNEKGAGTLSETVDVITTYDIVEIFTEPATQPNNTIFTGTFNFNLTKGAVSNLAGDITQSMTTGTDDPGCASHMGCPGGYGKVPMTTEPLKYQLKSEKVTLDGVEGLLVTTFKLDTPNTFYEYDFQDGYNHESWSPIHGVKVGGVHYGNDDGLDANPGNAYAMVFINLTDPTAPLTQGQIDRLAYADCTPGGMMGAACMTGTTVAGTTVPGYEGAVGTMRGFPSSQVITRKP